jgi:flagellar assembly protein FliH
MSSRLYRPEDSIAAQPIAWRQTSGSTVQTLRPRATDSGSTAGVAAIAVTPEHEIEARVQAAYQQGHAAGEAAGAQRASQRLDPVWSGLSGVIQELSSARKRIRAEAEQDMVKLAIAIARRVLHRELATDPEAILGLVKAAFGKLNARETHRLRTSPADAAAIQENRQKLQFPAGLEISVDASLPSGGAVFETSRGELDASVDTQLAEIDRGFADLIRSHAQ